MPEAKGATVQAGITFGCCLAMVISYVTNKSIIWALIHGVCSWLYVIYAALFL